MSPWQYTIFIVYKTKVIVLLTDTLYLNIETMWQARTVRGDKLIQLLRMEYKQVHLWVQTSTFVSSVTILLSYSHKRLVTN